MSLNYVYDYKEQYLCTKQQFTSIYCAVIESYRPLTHLPASAAYMRLGTGSALAQIMACRLFGAKSLPGPMLWYCQLDTWEQISVKYKSEFYHFHSRKCIWKCRLSKWQPFCSEGDAMCGSFVCIITVPLWCLLCSWIFAPLLHSGMVSLRARWIT